jgi:demethoxyubiquinone hydroxylase (CLK1/Coq7/Cat5 family)
MTSATAEKTDHRQKLIHLLHMAYSGEKAAGYAYSSHWRSLKPSPERDRIQLIEKEEWTHRAIVGRMLQELNDQPQVWREILMGVIGRTVGVACFFIGRFLPMYFAGKLEADNIQEYAHASYHAAQLGLQDYSAELMNLCEVEKEHELFFISAVRGHKLLPFMRSMFHWGPAIQSFAPGPGGGEDQ